MFRSSLLLLLKAHLLFNSLLIQYVYELVFFFSLRLSLKAVAKVETFI